MKALLLVLLLAPAAAHAQASDGGTTAPESDEQLKKELQAAIAADSDGGTAAPAAPAPSPIVRGAQSLNPDISAILDANGGYERRAVSFRNGDDPDLHGTATHPGAGFTAQEVELALSAIVDPYFKGEVYLTIPNLDGLEVEEAFATTTSLPGNLQIKAGSFRSAFGRQNGQHLHVQDFTRRPLLNAAFLGPDGLRGPGLQISWLAPLPFYLTLYGEAFSLEQPDPAGPFQGFGGGSRTDLTYAGEAKYFVPIGDDFSVYGGFNGATGVSSAGQRDELYGTDLYVKWKPPNVVGGYTSVAWQTEGVMRHVDGLDEWQGGVYSQIVMQVARSWFVGVRGDYVNTDLRAVRGGLSVTWQGSEFARVRGYVEAENASPANPATSLAAYLQLEFSIGAHGAHAF